MTTLAAARITILDPRKRATASGASVTGAQRDMRTDQGAELTIPLLDPRGALSSTSWLGDGDQITYAGTRYEFGGMQVKLGAIDQVVVRARSQLARRMRHTYKVSSTRKVTAGSWIAARARAHGGRALVQPSGARSEITQGSSQSELDVVAALCSDLGWVWCEYGNRLLAGQPWWWWSGDRLGRTWPLDRNGTVGKDANQWTDIDVDVAPDDRENVASGTIAVPRAVAGKIAPLHRLAVHAAGRASGTWLVTGVTLPLDSADDVALDVIKPRRPVKKKTKPKK